MPPRKDLIQEPLIATIIRLQLKAHDHQVLKQASRGLNNHEPRVEPHLVVSSSRELGQGKELVNVLEDQKVGVDEDDLVVAKELPYPELAVVPLVVGAFLGEGAADAVE